MQFEFLDALSEQSSPEITSEPLSVSPVRAARRVVRPTPGRARRTITLLFRSFDRNRKSLLASFREIGT
jgi:hypothetical protein